MLRNLRALPAASLVSLLGLTSCGTTRSGHYWGETATLVPSGDAFAQAARDAALDPWTWAPVAGAAALSISDWDEDISDWARDETPIFGSQKDAEDASDELRGLAQDAWLVSMAVVPSGDQLDIWARNKLQGYVIEWAGTYATSELTSQIKGGTNRERPDASDRRSFPSGHTSAASAYSSLAWRNVDDIEMPETLRWSLRGGLIALTAGTAWARVEAGKHYPTDVLVGAALGNFVTRFVHDSFLGPAGPTRITAFVEPDASEWSLGVAWSW